jgi:aminoglycoside 6'-N-acetyltransferase/ribosomal-protein-alanine N-acetyltransferase
VTFHPLHLTGATVTLREFTADDSKAVHGLVGDTRVTDYLSFDAKSPEQSGAMLAGILDRARHEPRTEIYLAVDADDTLIGFARLGLSGVKAAKLGYAIHVDHWGRGHATDAVRTLIRFGFDELGLHRITAAIGPNNPASIAVVEKLGFTKEGRLRDHVHTNGAWRDSILYSVLVDEWTT